MKSIESEEYLKLEQQCINIKEVLKMDQKKAWNMIIDLLYHYPHDPQPQNLLGIYAERNGDILLAMKHYRAGWDLSPWYRPTRLNMERIGDGVQHLRPCYYCDEDVEEYQTQEKQKILRRKEKC